MTEQEKRRECERICGEASKRNMHSMAPERCPILDDEWKGKNKPLHKYGEGIKGKDTPVVS